MNTLSPTPRAQALAILMFFVLLSWAPKSHAAGFDLIKHKDFTFTPTLQMYNRATLEFQENGTQSKFKISLLRAGFKTSFFEKKLKLRFNFELKPGRFDVLDAYFEGKVSSGLPLKIGIFTTPFTVLRQESQVELVSLSRPLFIKVFGGERQWGGETTIGVPKNQPGLRMRFGVFSGIPSVPGQTIWVSEKIFGESVPSPSALINFQLPQPVHPEVMAKVTYLPQEMDIVSDLDEEGGPFRWGTALSLAYDFAPSRLGEARYRIAQELVAKAYGFNAHTGFAFAGYDNPQGNLLSDHSAGVFGEVDYFLDQAFFVGIETSAVYINQALRKRGALLQSKNIDTLISIASESRFTLGHFFWERRVKMQVEAGIDHKIINNNHNFSPLLGAQLGFFL